MFSLMVELDTVDCSETVEFEIEGEDELDLLLDFLKELLYLSSIEGIFFKRFNLSIEKVDLYKVRVFAFGDIIDPDKHFIKGEVKMVTYHNILFKKSDDGRYKVRLLFDM
jgi:SHS2 domain-containing protein